LQKSKINLRLITQVPNFRVLLWEGDYLYGSRGYTLFRINGKEIGQDNLTIEKVAYCKPDSIRRIASENNLLRRLLRAGFHAIRMLDSKIIGIVAKNIVVMESNEKEFISTFKIKRGTRPLGMAVTPDGKIYWGEYFKNRKRKEVYIYGSEDGGCTWDVVYAFPKKTIRHVHNVLYDPYENCLWILTGDEGREPKIMKASLDWKYVDVILEGSQQARSATMIFKKDSIFFATDTPHEQNYIYRLDRKTERIEKIFPLPGPSMWSGVTSKYMFFSTASEPGRSYCDSACVFGSKNGSNWEKLKCWIKDKFHPKYFQFGNIIFPHGITNESFLATTGVAVKELDYNTLIWKILEIY